MSNPLLERITNFAPAGGINISQIMGMLKGKNPNTVMQLLAQKNPQFAEFYRSCQGKTPEQVAEQYGIDLNQFREFLK